MLITNSEGPLGAQLAREAESAGKVWILAAYVSASGLDILSLGDYAEEKPVRLVVGRVGADGITAATLRALQTFDSAASNSGGGVRIADPPSHAKLYAFVGSDGEVAGYIGSSNLSAHGLQSWREANLPLFGEPASAVLEEIQSAWDSGVPLDGADLAIAQPWHSSRPGDQPKGSEEDVAVSLPAGADGEVLNGMSLSLLDRSGKVQQRHGLNWGWAKARPPGQPRNPNDACIPLRARHIARAEQVFGSVASGTEFHAVMHDGTEMMMQLEGSVKLKGHDEKIAKQIASTPDKSAFGSWILREKLRVPEERRVARSDLEDYGRTEIALYRLGRVGRTGQPTVFVDFSAPQIEAESRDWSLEEVQLAVAAYFKMLELELQDEDYVKAEFRRRLASRLANRSEGAVEYKFQNISAVLDEQGYQWLEGYKPASNFQKLLRGPVLHELGRRPELRESLRR